MWQGERWERKKERKREGGREGEREIERKKRRKGDNSRGKKFAFIRPCPPDCTRLHPLLHNIYTNLVKILIFFLSYHWKTKSLNCIDREGERVCVSEWDTHAYAHPRTVPERFFWKTSACWKRSASSSRRYEKKKKGIKRMKTKPDMNVNCFVWRECVRQLDCVVPGEQLSNFAAFSMKCEV